MQKSLDDCKNNVLNNNRLTEQTKIQNSTMLTQIKLLNL